jgi:sigma-B regulation protein RsbU (phosphoserine phosphatase)
MEKQIRQHRVLIIDDSSEDRTTYRRLIARSSEHEFLFLEADTGEDGLRLYNTEQPDCVLLDYNLPDTSGLEFLARLDPGRGEDAPPIIMLTGKGTERVAVQALKLGAQDYLIKSRAAETVKYVSRAGTQCEGAARERGATPALGLAGAARERGALPLADRRRDGLRNRHA